MTIDDMIEVSEAADLLGVSESLLRIYFRADLFDTVKKVRGTKWMVSRQEIEDVVSEKKYINFSGSWSKVYGKRN